MSRHITARELKEDLKTYVLFFIITNVVGIALIPFLIEAATVVFVLSSVFGVITILIAIAYQSRLNRETMAKMLGKDYMKFCACKYCEKIRAETK